MEEANEFIERVQNGGVLPMITSCSPGWIKYCEHYFPDMTENLSSCKSPQQMFGAVAKSYYAEKMGIPKENMILDPGVGFAKSYEDNLEVLRHLKEFHALNMPLLLATSRKSVIGLTLDLPVDQREEGTLVTTVLAAKEHWNMVRVHDVKKNVRAIKMMEKIMHKI